ncbi:MAG: site-specific integrase [Bacteroidales bacterium]|nr:site-specific integrase [Bacteroidales bacterium]
MRNKSKVIKLKEPVRLRFKNLKNGNKSIYLDVYRDGVREYKFLKLYLIPETDTLSKTQNENTLQAANAIKSRLILEIANGAANIRTLEQSKIRIEDWVNLWLEEDKNNKSVAIKRIYKTALYYLLNYAQSKGKLYLKDINVDFIRGFIQYLATTKGRHKERLSIMTQREYFIVFSTLLNAAERKGVIRENPLRKLNVSEKPRKEESKREFLTVEEVRQLVKTPCNTPIKEPFLFCCFCGLRLSDVKKLEWGNIYENEGGFFADVTMQKTQNRLILPLSPEALKWLPERGEKRDEDQVFNIDRPGPTLNRWLAQWVKEAKIQKCVTFHVSRHTFATTLLTAGADIYTTSKLLGHRNVSTTQIYAKIIDEKKIEAVNMIGKLFRSERRGNK